MKAQSLKTLLFLFPLLLISRVLYADPAGLSAPVLRPEATESVLLPVPLNNGLYEKSYRSLSGKSRWKIRMHGLRNAPLHPAVWGMRREHRTLSRNLVAMRPFYLRASEDPGFSARSLSLSFTFETVTEAQMKSSPERFTPLLDIGFGGVLFPREGDVSVDRTYYVRLSGSSLFPSGLYFRNHYSSMLIEELPVVPSGKPIELTLEFKEKSISIRLNNNYSRTIKLKQSTEKGLIFLHTDWHPLNMDRLVVSGSNNSLPYTVSGLVTIPAGKAEKTGANDD